MSNALMAKFEVNGNPVELDAQTVRNYLTNGNGKATDQEVAMFINLCKYQKLNPFLREAYLIKYGDNQPATTVVGKDAFTKRAAEIKDCKGWKAGVCCVNQKNGQYVERDGTVVLPNEKLVGGWCEVKLARWEEPFKHTVQLGEYNTGKSMWAKMPATMIRKVAIVQALREAFPAQFQGMYDQSEMPTGGDLPETVIDIKPEPVEAEVVDESLMPKSLMPIGAAQKKALSDLLGSDKERILIAQKVLETYDYQSLKDILRVDYDAIMEELVMAFTEQEEEPEVIELDAEIVIEEELQEA